ATFAVMGSAAAMSIRNGTRRCCATETIALVLPESKEPSSIWAPWDTTRSASTRPFSGLVCVSPTISSSRSPPLDLIPPAALIASAAIWAPRRHAWPGSASGPGIGCTAPILNVLGWARNDRGAPATAAPATAVRRKVRRVTRAIVIMKPPCRGRWSSRARGARSVAALAGGDRALHFPGAIAKDALQHPAHRQQIHEPPQGAIADAELR